MSVTMPRIMLMACLLSPSLVFALGLGEIHLNSSLNEPMNAEIELIAAAPDELTALRATLASREAFARYGIDRPPFLSGLTFKVGKGKDGRDALLVHSTDAIPEPFVTFLVEVSWARGRLMREYTVLLDPPVYTPGESPSSSAPVTAPVTAATAPAHRAAPVPVPSPTAEPAAATAAPAATPNTVRVGRGDTLIKIVHGLQVAGSPADVDKTMISLFRSNPEAFGGNINVLRQGAILRVPNSDQIAALNQREAIGEVHRQMEAWRGAEGAAGSSGGHLRLVTPGAGGTGTAAGGSGGAETQALKDRVKDLESQLAESKRLIDIRNGELAALQRKLGAPTPPAPVQPAPVQPPVATRPAVPAAPPAAAPPPVAAPPAATVSPAPAPAVKKAPAVAPTPSDTGSWIDWVAANWWVPLALLAVVIAGLGFAAMKRRRDQSESFGRALEETDVAERREPAARIGGARKSAESFVVEESGPHPAPDFNDETGRFGDTAEVKSPDDTMSSESAVNLDQGDPLAEADFHMAYGLYDQAADLVRIALEREPDRRDLRLKLLEIYFVWGNKDAFLQAAKTLEATKDKAAAGEWDKIAIMGRQICPDDPLFAAGTGGGRGAGTLVDLNLEGGENRVDIDLFGDPEGERSSLDHEMSDEAAHPAAVNQHAGSDHLDFTLDTPERGADESPTREMAPPRPDEPTVESELMNFSDANPLEAPGFAAESVTAESPALKGGDVHERIAAKLPQKADQTAELSLDDLGLDLDSLEQTGTSNSISQLEETDHPSDAPTMVAGLDERSRQLMAQAARAASPDPDHTSMTERDRDLTELERELEASFIAELDSHHETKTAVLGPESAPTVMMPREVDPAATSSFKAPDFAESQGIEKVDLDSTSKLRGISAADSIDLDLDHLTSALGGGDTLEQPRAAEDMFSSEVFEASQRNKLVDLDVGEALNVADAPTNKLQAQTNKLRPVDLEVPELEPVTMSEVGTKLDLARAYMDMGDPEGARSILEEVVQEGSTSQKQEASRLIESLPG